MNSPDDLSKLLLHWKSDPNISSNIIEWKTFPARGAIQFEFPSFINPILKQALNKTKGIDSLYSHQFDAIEKISNGKNIVISTGPASGKSLCYNIPIINSILEQSAASALYIFPTKALAHDQLENILDLGLQIHASVYDGDTPPSQRCEIRSNTRILITNPDMLHMGVLPHHTIWMEFLKRLKYVVLDEIHIYRGVFGSNVSNLIRRLKRIVNFYGGNPQFIMTSATIGNPGELAEKLSGSTVYHIDSDGSPSGEKHFLLYNPPFIREDLGLRNSASSESSHLFNDLSEYKIQTLIFAKTRKGVEHLLTTVKRGFDPDFSQNIRGYRSGYLAKDRREIEEELRSGETKAVIATNALELGINIGSIGAVLMVGYPGTISSVRQQAGRAGRKHSQSLAIMIASAGLIDQFITNHPNYIFNNNPENALIDPDNLLILWKHLRCAAFELPFEAGESFGDIPPEVLEDILGMIKNNGELNRTNDRYFWVSGKYPANEISLRTTSSETVILQVNEKNHIETIGKVDRVSATWMVHPGAIYFHESRAFYVQDLDLDNNKAGLTPGNFDYYTEPKEETSFEKIASLQKNQGSYAIQEYGEINVHVEVVGFQKVHNISREILATESITMPEEVLRTYGFWISLNEPGIELLRQVGTWNNDANDYGPDWPYIRELARKRDQYTCQVCGSREVKTNHHVHHISPFRSFQSSVQANQLENLITLCPRCHSRAELNIRIRSGMEGFSYIIHNLASLFLMCDINDIGADFDPGSVLTDGSPAVVLYDMIPGGIGLAHGIFENWALMIKEALDVIDSCECTDGCPSCVGPGSENGSGCKAETRSILDLLNGNLMEKNNGNII